MKLRLHRDGRTFDLVGLKQLGSGGEACVYALDGTPWAAKVYHGPVTGRDDKLRVMLANPPRDPTYARGHVSIAWPRDLLIDQHGRIVGFVMPLVTQMRRMIDFYNPKTRRKECPLFTYQYLSTTAHNLAIAVRALHQREYVMGDVNESNILVAETTMVTLVDTDSFQVRESGNGKIHHCTVASPLFTPREMQGMDFATVERREEHDLFGLGVLLFQLLMEGTHPFQVRYTGVGDPPDPVQVIRNGHFPHDTGSAMWQPPPLAPPFGMLDLRLRHLFTRCFVNGHRDPKARPTADEWCSNLAAAVESLVRCRINPSHIYWPHLNVCPWCERTEKLRGRDPFPDPAQLRLGGHGSHLTQSTPKPWMPVVKSGPHPAAHVPRPTVSWWKRLWGATAAVPTPTPAATQVRVAVPAPTPAATQVRVAVPTPTPAATQVRVAVPTPTPAAAQVRVAVPTPTPAAAQVRVAVPAPNPAAAQVRVAVPAPNPAAAQVRVAVPAPNPAAARARVAILAPGLAATLWPPTSPQFEPLAHALFTVDIGRGAKLSLCGIPAGTFVMGGTGDDETPHKVTLTKGFWLGRTEVTQEQWQELMGSNPSKFIGKDLPVENVSWDDAMEFCGKLNGKKLLPSGWKWALPTEAQWEYACRAGTTSNFAGDLGEMAWYGGNSDRKTHPVGIKKPNEWGLYDMHGNVWEWCADCYEVWYYTSSVTDPTGPDGRSFRVFRGGSWGNNMLKCRAAYRNFNNPKNTHSSGIGFRVAAVVV